MRLTNSQKIAVALNGVALLVGVVVLIGTATGNYVRNDIGDEPVVIAITAAAIAILVTWSYYFVLKKRKENNRKRNRSIEVAALPTLLACGISLFVLPALFAPVWAPVIWWCVIVVCSFLSILYLWTHRAPRAR